MAVKKKTKEIPPIDLNPLNTDQRFAFDELRSFIADKEDDTIYSIPTKNGLHLICRPFNSAKFCHKYPEVDVHKDNPTILFVP